MKAPVGSPTGATVNSANGKIEPLRSAKSQ
jgi:hypothetical protein